jgi:hypothetical protein
MTTPAAIAVIDPTGDNSGRNDTAQINAALQSLPGQGGVLALNPGIWYTRGGGVVIPQSGIWLSAPGAIIRGIGAGDLFRMFDASDYDSRQIHSGGMLGNPVIDGSAMAPGSTGWHAGDIFNLQNYVTCQNFKGAGSFGAHLDNNYWFTELAQGFIRAAGCTTGVAFDVSQAAAGTVTGSFARGDVTAYVETALGSNQGMAVLGGAILYDGKWTLRGNFASSAQALTSSALQITGSTPAGAAIGSSSTMISSLCDIAVECASGAHTPQTINFGGGANQISNCYGQMDFSRGAAFAASNNASNVLNFYGPILGDNALASWLEAVLSNSSSGAQAITSATPAPVAGASGQLNAFQVTRVRAWIPYSAAVAAGTPVFSFTGPGGQIVTNLVAKFTSGGVQAAPVFLTDYTGTITGPTLTSAATHLLEIEGTVLGNAAGTLQLTAAEGVGGDSFTIEAGAYMSVIQSNY